jgi:protein-L-isoaspartate(D-aspartate) O-methyltransferase
MVSPSTEDLVDAVRRAGVREAAVMAAVRAVPRAGFVPAEQVALANLDQPISIPHGQVTTQPSLTARMVAALRLGPADRVLEIGTGYGYQTAILARLAATVVSVERWADIADEARRNLAAQGVANVGVVVGDGTNGVPDHAPYDAILVSAAFPTVPPPLIDQLRLGGRLVQPIGPGGAERVTLFERMADGLAPRDVLCDASFVRLYGHHGYP